MTDRRVRIIRPWQFYRIGQLITPAGMLRQWLIEHKFAEPYTQAMEATEKAAAIFGAETATLGAAPERAVLPAPMKRKRKRSRPRKSAARQGG
jgi:hypothetical protein